MTDDNCTRGACDRRIPRRDDPDHGDPDLVEAAFFLSPAPKNTDERCNEGNYANEASPQTDKWYRIPLHIADGTVPLIGAFHMTVKSPLGSPSWS
jgi:hypothetical protein